jgi:diguanylate cyclase (GGDEF)-like protein
MLAPRIIQDPHAMYRPTTMHPSRQNPALPEAGLMAATDLRAEVLSILEQRNLHAVFQPILDLHQEAFIGFEGLIRGPVGTHLHAPAQLFCAARDCGLSLEIEMLCRQVVLEAFAEARLPGRLFLNVSPAVLTHPSFRNGQTLQHMRRLGITPEQVTIEITEDQPFGDIAIMRDAFLHYRSMGFRIALDDLGEGFSSLRLWSELHPEYVKIDKHFVKEADRDPLKRQFLKSFQQIADSSGCQIIAEGIETEAEFLTVKGLGIALGQGYFIGRPGVSPALAPAATALPVARKAADLAPARVRHPTARQLIALVEPATPETVNNEIYARFSDDPALNSIPIVAHGRPTGLVSRHAFMERFAQPFQRELLGNKPCSLSAPEVPLRVEQATPLQEISRQLGDSRAQRFSDDFIITDNGYYLGIGSWFDLLRTITHMQIEAARHANPLTLLPGNVPIHEHISQLLDREAAFCVCYCDLDNFKPFNDAYGYYRGDEMIRLTGSILTGACEPAIDFIGHIGGDDFILLMQSPDWEQRCQSALRAFAAASVSLADEAHRDRGGYDTEDRGGNTVFHPLPTLSIGACCVEPGVFRSPIEVADAASEAKKVAKRAPGNSLHIEKPRRYAVMQ